jgi:hypothetical protein
MIVQIAEIQTKGLFITHPRIDAFLYSIRVVCLCSSVNIELENSAVEKRSLFPALADLCKLSRHCSLSAALSMQSLFRIRPVSMSTKMVPGQGLQCRIYNASRQSFLMRVRKRSCWKSLGTLLTQHPNNSILIVAFPTDGVTCSMDLLELKNRLFLVHWQESLVWISMSSPFCPLIKIP